MMIINKYFNKREVQKKHWDKWYCEDYGELLERTKSLNYWYTFRIPGSPCCKRDEEIGAGALVGTGGRSA